MSDAFALNRRAHERKSSILTATVTAGEAVINCTVQDISIGGAQILASLDLSSGRHVVLNLDPYGEMPAEVAWCRRGKLGLRFEGDPQVMAEIVMSIAMQGN